MHMLQVSGLLEPMELVNEILKQKKFSDDSRALYRYFNIDMKDGSWFLAKHGETVLVPAPKYPPKVSCA